MLTGADYHDVGKVKLERVDEAWARAQALGFTLANPKGTRKESCYIDI